jgi:amino acid adenylation domain-containing protein
MKAKAVLKDTEIESIYPLSPMQQGLLYESVYSGSWEYFQQKSYTLHGDLNVACLKRAWEHVVARHAVLRTLFMWENREKPLQVVLKRVELPWEEYDWRHIEQSEREEMLKSFLRADLGMGFELSRAPLMRFSLTRMDQDIYQFTWSHHHLLLDGWSAGLVRNEVFALYEQFCLGKNVSVQAAPPFRDYIAWLERQDVSTAESFWREKLKGLTARTPLIQVAGRRDRNDAKILREHYQLERVKMSQAVTARLQLLARTNRLTINILVQAAWALLLSRYCGEHDVVFGSVVAGRPANLEGVDSMVGVFINTLPVRVSIHDQIPLIDSLNDLKSQQTEASQYQHTPLVEIQGWSEIPRGQPLFDSIVVLIASPLDLESKKESKKEKRQAAVEVRNMYSVEKTNYPIALEAAQGRRLSVQIVYDGALFESVVVGRMLRHFEVLLARMAGGDPHQMLGSIDLLTDSEQRQLLIEWNNTAAGPPLHGTISALFQEQASRVEDAVAAVCEDEQVTYGQLAHRTSGLAVSLAAKKVGPDVLVALLAHRGIDFLTGVLAVFKAGGAYLPLDPRYPASKLGQLIEQSRSHVVLASDDLMRVARQAVEAVPRRSRPSVIRMAPRAAAAHQAVDIGGLAGPGDLAYVIFTSGSTGVPKGAMIEQRGMVNHLFAKIRALGLTDLDRVAQTASQTFDISVWQLLAPLAVGGAVEIVTDQDARDSERLLATVEQRGITVLEIVPSLLRAVLDGQSVGDAEPFKLQSLRWLLVTGEALPPALFNRWHERYPEMAVLNAYGPTECSDDVTHYAAPGESGEILARMPIGKPVDNLRIYIADRGLRLLPVQMPGELLVGGTGVGRGYLDDPSRTAELFVPDPFSETGGRLYKSGDMARCLEDGNIEYLGRLDNQIKLRGYRIELGEIEAVLNKHPLVSQAVVVAREETEGDKRLVGYVVPEDPLRISTPELREYLKGQLPEYMIPAAFVLLESLPLSANGKVNRKMLPAPNAGQVEKKQRYAAPRNELQRKLVSIWEGILNVRPVGVNDKFFELGGHSLLSLRLMVQIKQNFGRLIPLDSLIKAETIEDLAALLQEKDPDASWSPLVALQPRGDTSPFFCVHPISGNPFCYLDLSRGMGIDRPFYGLQSRIKSPFKNIEEMASCYISAIKTLQPEGPYLLGGWSMGGLVAFEMASQLTNRGEQVGLLAIIDTKSSNPDEERLDESILKARFSGMVDLIKEQVRKADGSAPEVDTRLYQRMFRMYVANNRAEERYIPGPYPGRVTLLRAENSLDADPDLTLGWGLLAGDVKIHTIPGTHSTMLIDSNAKVLADCLMRTIHEDSSYVPNRE